MTRRSGAWLPGPPTAPATGSGGCPPTPTTGSCWPARQRTSRTASTARPARSPAACSSSSSWRTGPGSTSTSRPAPGTTTTISPPSPAGRWAAGRACWSSLRNLCRRGVVRLDTPVLESIHSPADLRHLSAQELDELAREIRAFLVETISQTGGHLSPNLGVVELTLALHRVFDSPRDALVWDTGHQAYVHKLVTGRKGGFDSLRQEGGLSGYPSRAESEHDLVENSHASTSLSYALGIAEARLRKGQPGDVVAVIGDGALTGGMAYEALNQIELLQPATMFDSLGIKYSGPVDGHDRPAIEDLLRRARRHKGPVVVHVATEKGRGYGPAVEEEIDRMHGVSAFDPLTGHPRRTELTWSDVFGEAVFASAQRHPDLVAITAAMASSTGLLNFAREFPDRFFDVGICEQHAVTFAAGLAMSGLRPVVAIYSTFLQRAFDQVIMDVALHKLPVVFVLDRAGVTGPDGSSHHGVFDLSYLRMIPNLKVAAPADATELCALLETALALDGPVAIRYPKGAVPAPPDLPVEPLPVGRWEEVRRGADACILAIGRMVEVAGEAAERLELQGVSCTVVNARWA